MNAAYESFISAEMTFLEATYELGKTDEMPEWEEIKPRVEKRLRYVLERPEKVSL